MTREKTALKKISLRYLQYFETFSRPRCPNSFSREFLHANSFKLKVENLGLICNCSVVFPSKNLKFTFFWRILAKY